MKTLKIRKKWYYGAGSVYKWKDDGYDIFGVGIARKYFDEPELQIEIDGGTYIVDMVKAREFVRKYHSHYMEKGVRIGVISRSLLEAPVQDLFKDDIAWFDALPEHKSN